MAHDILAKLRDSLLLRASVATVAAIVLLGVASGALPLTCFAGLAACGTATTIDAASTPAKATAEPATAAVSKADSGKVSIKVAEVSPPTLTHNDVVGGSFAKLNVDLSPPPGDTELKTRVVTTVAIGPDGQPQTGASQAAPVSTELTGEPALRVATPQVSDVSAVAEADAPADAATLAGGVAAAADSVPPPAARPHQTAVASELAVAPPASKTPAKAVAKTARNTAVIKGSGANVHASASKSGKVLFSIGPGETVTVTDDSHGWLKVTDDSGRTGWVWEELVSR